MLAFDRAIAEQEADRAKAAEVNARGGAVKRAEFNRRLAQMRGEA